jgi:Spy/CpxP family protein refolding chaperone
MEALQNQREERRTQAEERQKAHNAQMKAILTPEQYTRYLELRQERRMEHRSKGDMKRKGGGKNRDGRSHNRPAGGPQ